MWKLVHEVDRSGEQMTWLESRFRGKAAGDVEKDWQWSSQQ